jgi:hypothetical protein
MPAAGWDLGKEGAEHLFQNFPPNGDCHTEDLCFLRSDRSQLEKEHMHNGIPSSMSAGKPRVCQGCSLLASISVLWLPIRHGPFGVPFVSPLCSCNASACSSSCIVEHRLPMESVSGLMCFCLLPRLDGLAGLNCDPAQPLQKP